MRKIFFLSVCLLLTVFTSKSFAQSVIFLGTDTVEYANPGDAFYCEDSLKNTSNKGLWVDAIRVLNDTAPGWGTSLCLDVCYPQWVDSANEYFYAQSAGVFRMHFYSDSVADTSTVIVRFRNESDSTNVFYKKFVGITVKGLHANEIAEDVSVQLFPSPVIAGSTFCFRISDRRHIEGNYSLIVYDVCGNRASHIDGLVSGDNYFSMNLPQGIYIYNLINRNSLLKTGKIAVTK
ncbi:MAG: hypothetical protein HY063_06560 [Bacteroidetes bacterium]|nr:hypothetical protein [Bacteroidota bacterium]